MKANRHEPDCGTSVFGGNKKAPENNSGLARHFRKLKSASFCHK
jgi:hypothetical protein